MTGRFLFSGHVQGVGFRYTAHAIAVDLGLRGWVRNLADGSVELVAESSQAGLDDLLKQINERMGRHIKSVFRGPGTLADDHAGFQIVR